MAIYTQKTSKGQLLSVSVVALASGQYKVEVRGIEPFYEADNSFQDQASATKHAQAMLDEYGWRLEEMYERDAQAALLQELNEGNSMAYVIDIKTYNGFWHTETATSAEQAYALVCGSDAAQAIEIDNVDVSTHEALEAWYQAQQTAAQLPADVDMGGDFEGFVEAVNQSQTEQVQVWYTDEVTSADGEKIKARVSVSYAKGERRFVLEVLASGVVIEDQTETFYFESLAREAAVSKAMAYLQRLNAVRAAEMGDETETIYPLLTDKAGRKAQLEAHITRLRRELQDYEYEYSQLQGE